MKVVCIAGVGLIGGSFALALRQAGFTGKIVGVSSPSTLAKARDLGVIDEGLSLEEAAAVSDLVYLAQPIAQILETLGRLDQHVRPGTLITDAGSTKSAIVERAASTIKRGHFVGGHPMAGKESRGVESADANLFRNRPYVLTDLHPELSGWIAKIGARVVVLSAADHDRLVAFTSHLPQLISTALASTIGSQPNSESVAGPASIDLTRLALSPYDIWRDILSTNAPSIDAALGAFIERLQSLRSRLQDETMSAAFDQASAAAKRLRR